MFANIKTGWTDNRIRLGSVGGANWLRRSRSGCVQRTPYKRVAASTKRKCDSRDGCIHSCQRVLVCQYSSIDYYLKHAKRNASYFYECCIHIRAHPGIIPKLRYPLKNTSPRIKLWQVDTGVLNRVPASQALAKRASRLQLKNILSSPSQCLKNSRTGATRQYKVTLRSSDKHRLVAKARDRSSSYAPGLSILKTPLRNDTGASCFPFQNNPHWASYFARG